MSQLCGFLAIEQRTYVPLPNWTGAFIRPQAVVWKPGQGEQEGTDLLNILATIVLMLLLLIVSTHL
jgi:hypothetical protein